MTFVELQSRTDLRLLGIATAFTVRSVHADVLMTVFLKSRSSMISIIMKLPLILAIENECQMIDKGQRFMIYLHEIL